MSMKNLNVYLNKIIGEMCHRSGSLFKEDQTTKKITTQKRSESKRKTMQSLKCGRQVHDAIVVHCKQKS